MDSSLYEGIQIADGYRFTDQLTSPYRLAYGHLKSPCSAVMVIDVNGSEPEELLGGDTEQRKRIVCFSPDGSTLYYHVGQFYAKDLVTRAIRRLVGIPQEPPFDEFRSLECSPDNRTIVLMQTAIPHMVRGSAPVSPYRLCRVCTDGSSFKVLYEDPPEYRLHTVDCCWQHGFVLFARSKHSNVEEGYELWRLELESGHLEFISRCSDVGWNFIVHPDGKQVAWSSFLDGIYLCSLESGTTKKILASGTSPAWSPDGKLLAVMNDQHRLCFLDMQSGRSQDLVWFEPPNVSFKERRSSYAVQPVWSPDGRMLWFALTQTQKLPPPRNLSEALVEAKRSIYPLLHNLNPKRTSHFGGYKRHCHRQRRGILDLYTKQVLLSTGYLYGVTWLPQAALPAV